MRTYSTIQLLLKKHLPDVKGLRIEKQCAEQLNIETGYVHTSKLFSIKYELKLEQVQAFAHQCIKDALTDEVLVNEIAPSRAYGSCVTVAKLPGVTDDEGTSAQMALVDFMNLENIDTATQHIFSQEVYYFEKTLAENQLKRLTNRLLANPLIHKFHFYYPDQKGIIRFVPYVPKVQMTVDKTTQFFDLNLSDEELIHLSKTRVWALNLAEMKAIRAHYELPEVAEKRKKLGLSTQPSDCELEVLAQTWSEHCKHKEFNAIIHYENKETGRKETIHSLFKTYIKGATTQVQKNLEQKENDWLVKVFSDNAGVVKASEDQLFVWKVETHNSPSALDPYGGALTGILGNNRDPIGTGVGGARLLFNTNVLCFGSPQYDKPLLTGQLHPRRILQGVVAGIEDGGNKSGVPTVNGAVVFDDRYSGKPLVYCGTGALMPYAYKGRASWKKPIEAGDLIIMAGGRVGKDGIHGATFSSIEIDAYSPQSAVQIGSPITQKKMYDLLLIACREGLIKCSTDNGAGGLSSSVGELATLSNGAIVHLEQVPLKYAGLRPWEIFVSESQERMTLVVSLENKKALFELAALMEVELSAIGMFTDNGALEIYYGDECIAHLDMKFLHDGVPQKVMYASWEKPNLVEPKLADFLDYNDILLNLLASPNICSREEIIRQYDHEVKGRTVIKPLMGPEGKAPQDAAVMRLSFETYEGIAISNGILPRYGDIDAYEMSAGAFDEAVRQIISVGGRLPNTQNRDGIFWSVNDNFCVPDSQYHPVDNPNGKVKLAKLVQMCQALYDMATYFDIPLTSGKDSMKNDFKADGQKISVPPTVLYSMSAKVNDIRQTITSEFKAAGDLIYQLGTTYDELGGSEFYQLYNELGANVPKVRKEEAKALYLKVMEANARALIESSHDLSDGGLLIALAESAFGAGLGAEVDLNDQTTLSTNAQLFSESHSRFLVTIRPEKQTIFEAVMGDKASRLGRVRNDSRLVLRKAEQVLVDQDIASLKKAWAEGLTY